MTILEQLAALVAETGPLPVKAAEAACRSVADLMTSSTAGSATAGGRAAQVAAQAVFGSGPAPLWFLGKRSSVTGAAFANAAIACMLDLDDGHRAAAGHPGAAVIPAVLAEAARAPYPLPRLLDAIAIGYEVGIRLSRARNFASLDTTATGRWSGQGAAAALGWLRGTPAQMLAQALAIADSHAPNLARATVRSEAGHVKEGIPWANASGVAALELAEAGHTGALDGREELDTRARANILEGWGRDWLIEGTYFKPYACCRWAHAALDGLAALTAEKPIDPAAIETIEVDVFSRALSLSNLVDPPSIEAAQYSIPYVIGLFVVHGADALLPIRPDRLNDLRAIAVAARVTLRVDPTFDAMFPGAAPSRVTVTEGGYRRCREVHVPLGEPGNPMDWAMLRAKQHTVCAALAGNGAAERLWSGVEAMRAGNITPLLALLAAPLAAPAALVAE